MQKKPLFFIFIPLLTISALIYFNNDSPPIRFVAGLAENIFEGPKNFITGVKTASGEDDGSLSELEKENEELVKKLVEVEKINRDNVALRSQFEESTTKDYELLPAKVIGFIGKFSFPDSLIIDQGSHDLVREDMAVVLQDRVVGKISKVSENYSEITLVTNPNFTGLGRSSEKGAPGIINGASDFILFDRVEVNEEIVVGEFVLTKGEVRNDGIGIPPDLIVGKIASVNRSENLPHQSAKIESDIQFSKLDTVFIVLGL